MRETVRRAFPYRGIEPPRRVPKVRNCSRKGRAPFAALERGVLEEDLLDFAPKRLGHCVLLDDTNVDKMVRETNACVEACLTCHRKHFGVPAAKNIFGRLRAAGHPVVLGTDNPSIYGIGLSHEFETAARTAFPFANTTTTPTNITLADLFELAVAPIEHAFCGEGTKRELRELAANRIEALKRKYGIVE